jgi:hypothetical protein
MMSDDLAATTRRLRPRFSLLTILFLFALVGCGITIWQLWREVGPLREEVRRLRDEVGELAIDDATKIHAIETRQPDELTWRWRLWIPEGRTYVIRSTGGEIPKVGFPQLGGSMWVREPGEIWIEYRITKDPHSGTWRGSIHRKEGSVGSDEQPWVDWGNRSGTGEGVGTSTRSYAPDETVVITRQRFGQSVPSSEDIPDPAPGFMIWLEPQ